MAVNRVLDEIAKLMTDTAGAAQGMRKEIENVFRSQAEKALNKFDLVRREDFESLKEMAAKTKEETDALKSRIETLEKNVKTKAGLSSSAVNTQGPK